MSHSQARQKAAEEARAATEARIAQATAESKERFLREYAAKQEQRRLVERQKKTADREPGEILSQDSSINVTIRSAASSQANSVDDKDSDRANTLAAFKPRKEKSSVQDRPTKFGEDTSVDGSRLSASRASTDALSDKAKAKMGSVPNRQTLPSISTESTDTLTTSTRTSFSAPEQPASPTSRIGQSSSRSSFDDTKRSFLTKRSSTDDRRPTLQSLGKIPKRSTMASPQTADRSTGQLTSVGDERPPKWYNDTPAPNTRQKNQSQVDVLLAGLRTQIRLCKESLQNRDAQKLRDHLTNLRDRLHKIIFQEVTPPLLKLHRMLHNDSGLPAIFDQEHNGGLAWPFDVKADAEELYNKWARRMFETDILRGIKFKPDASGKNNSGKAETGKNTASIVPEYKVDAHYYGNGDLLNGQWWPLQICALRDGAHGVTQAGICGSIDTGAYSVIMAGGRNENNEKYPNEDYGNKVLYCGTDSTDGKPTGNTSMMLASVKKRPVRLIRSSKLGGEYAPSVGFRYDGLYDVIGFENMDGAESERQRHRFVLIRCENQDPIRGGNGPERRPTVQEEQAYDDKKKFGGVVE